MIVRVKTIITTDIDIETLVPIHSVEIETDDDLPEIIVASASYGACRATMNTMRSKYPMVFKNEPLDEPDADDDAADATPTQKLNWQPGDPCGNCGSTNTFLDSDPTVGARCLDCGASDDDE